MEEQLETVYEDFNDYDYLTRSVFCEGVMNDFYKALDEMSLHDYKESVQVVVC